MKGVLFLIIGVFFILYTHSIKDERKCLIWGFIWLIYGFLLCGVLLLVFRRD